MNDETTLFGGESTDPEIERLLQHSEMGPGDSISYQEVATLIGSDHESVRFWTVTQRWRRLYEDVSGVLILCDGDNKTFYGATAPDRLRYAALQAKKARRRTRRAHHVALSTDTEGLSIEERDALSKVAQLTGVMALAYRREVRRLSTAAPLLETKTKGKNDEGLSRNDHRRVTANHAPRQSQLRGQLESLAEQSRKQRQVRKG